MFEGEQRLFWGKPWDKEAWVFAAQSLTEKIEIAVAPLDLYDFSVGQKVELRWSSSTRLDAKLVVALVNYVFLMPSRSSDFNLQFELKVYVF